MVTINRIALDIPWSVKYVFCSIFQRSLDEGRKEIVRQFQSAILNQQMQKGDTHLLKCIRSKNKHKITLFHYENTLLRSPYTSL